MTKLRLGVCAAVLYALMIVFEAAKMWFWYAVVACPCFVIGLLLFLKVLED